MKTAVSIPGPIFEEAERFAHAKGVSRSQVFSNALSEYLARHSPDQIRETMNRVCEQVGEQSDQFVTAAGRRVLERAEW